MTEPDILARLSDLAADQLFGDDEATIEDAFQEITQLRAALAAEKERGDELQCELSDLKDTREYWKLETRVAREHLAAAQERIDTLEQQLIGGIETHRSMERWRDEARDWRDQAQEARARLAQMTALVREAREAYRNPWAYGITGFIETDQRKYAAWLARLDAALEAGREARP